MQILEDIYKMYPRKRGKTKGMERLRSLLVGSDGRIDTDLADQIMTSIQNYRKECVGREQHYILHFSTFMNRWEDFLEEDVVDLGDPFELPEVDLNGCEVSE